MKFIPKSVTRKVARTILKTKKNSPHIFFAAGVVGVVGAGVLACKATLKLDDTLEEIKSDLELVKAHRANDETPERDYQKDMGAVYGHAAIQLVKLYGPAIAVGLISISALAGSHIQLTRRNAALSAALATVTKAYEEYRQRIREVLGDEKELDIYRNVEKVKVGGQEVVSSTNPSKYSMYARVFDEGNRNWQKDSELNQMFIRAVETTANHRLRANGHVFLNDIYRDLGFEDTTEGQMVGWIWNSERGDNYIDFGLGHPDAIRFLEGFEYSIWLDFNVDGPIFENI